MRPYRIVFPSPASRKLAVPGTFTKGGEGRGSEAAIGCNGGDEASTAAARDRQWRAAACRYVITQSVPWGRLRGHPILGLGGMGCIPSCVRRRIIEPTRGSGSFVGVDLMLLWWEFGRQKGTRWPIIKPTLSPCKPMECP